MTRRSLAGLAAALTVLAGLPAPVLALSQSTANAAPARTTADDGSGARRVSRSASSPQHPATSTIAAASVPCNDSFGVVSSPSPGTGSNGLNAVSGVSAADAWAVGASLATGGLFQTLTEHWDGTQWTVVPSANNTGEDALFGVAAITSTDVWAVGYWRTGTTAIRQPLIEHWNGTAWTISSIAAIGGGDNALESVTAASSTDVWAVGYSRPGNTLSRIPLTWHWDGHTWTNRAAPTQGTGSNVFYGVASMSGVTWAAGYWATDDTATGTYHPLLELWNGTAWVAGSAPFQGSGDSVLDGVAAISASDFWAVGYQEATPGAVVQNLTYHYPGPAGSTGPWVYVPSPNANATVDNFFNGVGATPSGDVWALGEYGTSTTPYQSDAVQWNGTAWTMVPVANFAGITELIGAWTISKRNVVAVGDYVNGIYQTLVEQLCNPDPPSAPTGVTAAQFAWNGGMNVSWQAPAQDGGSPINSYRVTVYVQGAVSDVVYVGGSPPATTTQYFGSSFGSTYTFTVAAQNQAGWSAESAPSNGVVVITTPYPPVNLATFAGHGEASVIWTAQHAVGRPITGWTVSAFRQGFPGTGPTIHLPADASSATISGLTDGTAYSVDVEATNVFGTSATTLAGPVTPTAVPLGNPVVTLPAVANGAYGGYTTVTSIQNISSNPANITVKYFDASGNLVGVGNSAAALPANASWSLRNDNPGALPVGTAGSAIVYSDQPVSAFVNEFAPGGGDATSYTGINPISGTGTTLFAPAIANGAYGGYTTGIGLINLSSSSATVTVTYRDSSGTVAKTQTLNVAGGAYQGLYSGDAGLGLPAGFAGTATIGSSVGNLAAVVNETGPGGQFSSYDAVPAGSTTLYAPAALNNAYGGYNTGMGIQNTTGSAGTVTITYYDAAGAATVKTFPIVANGYVGVYQGTDIPASGAYTANLSSTVAIAAIVNEVAPSSNPSVQQSTAYNTFATGSLSLHLPLVESAGPDGWSTGEGIMNTGSAATTVTVTYFDVATGAPIGTPQSLTLGPNAFWGLYQPAGGLPNGARASAVVTTTGQPVAVICNESSATAFMSYSGQ